MDHSDHGAHVDHASMNHSGHDMMNHSGHDTMDHSNHDMMDHSSHDVLDMDPEVDVGGNLHDHSSHGVAGHMMKMYFHFGYMNETVLFEGWVINSIGALIGSMVGIFFIALHYEGLKYFREFMFRQAVTKQQAVHTATKGPISTDENKPIQYMDQVLLPSPLRIWSGDHLLQTFLHMYQFVISYFLMLIFMTYNVWLCVAVVLGAGVGYFAFGWRKSVAIDVTEHCH